MKISKIKIMSDGTCDLPVKIVEKYNIGIVPVNVIFNEEEVRQPYVDLTNDEFYERLVAGENVKTGVPGPKVFKDKFDEAFKEAEEVIMITISSKLSAVYQTALLVKNQFFDDKLTVVDSNSGTIETGLVVYEAVKKLAETNSKEEVLKHLNETVIPNAHLISYAATLKYLRRGGRISRLAHLMGSVLKIKPIFHIGKEGEIVSPGKIMLWQNIDVAFKKLIERVAGHQITDTIFVAHSGNKEKCQKLIDYFKSQPGAPKEILMAEVGPAVGVHVGPETFGFVWIGEYKDEWFEDL